MSNVYFLRNFPCERQLNVGKDTSFSWDGYDTLTLSIKGGRQKSILHFKPGDAVRVSQEGNLVKLSKLEPPHTLPGVVLWACQAEKNARVKDLETYQWRLDKFKSTHRILEPEPSFSPTWKPEHRIRIERCTGPFLFLINEEKLQIARYAKHKGTMWATVAAYCNLNISKEEATELIQRHGIISAPRWYLQNAIQNASNEKATPSRSQPEQDIEELQQNPAKRKE